MAWEQKLQKWTKRASDNEDEQRERTERQIKAAIAAHPNLCAMPLKVYTKGSYPNNTNVKLDSDIDINVEYHGGFYYDLDDTDDQTLVKASAAIPEYRGPYGTFDSFKREVCEALERAFGSGVSRDDKCIKVRERKTTLPADVVPCWEYRWYYRGYASRVDFHQGAVLFPDTSPNRRIVNYPQQHYASGVEKNNRTSRRYKQAVRMLKRLENEMVGAGVIAEVPSYLIECLVHACPNTDFKYESNIMVIREVLASIFNNTAGVEPSDDRDRWLEANDIKFLFHPAQKWTRSDAHQFAFAAWQYVGLK